MFGCVKFETSEFASSTCTLTFWNEDLALSKCAVLLTIDGEEAFTGLVLMQWLLCTMFTLSMHAMSVRPHHTHSSPVTTEIIH